MDQRRESRGLSWAGAFALAALILYPLAVSLPVMQLRKLGHVRDVTVWSGAVELLGSGHTAVGVLVFLCSIVIPLMKLLGIFLLGFESPWRGRGHQRLRTHRVIDWVGRWGMLDVLLVAVLVAAIKLGSWADISPGPGVIAFASVVVLSLLASAVFDVPRAQATVARGLEGGA
ncbi:MAG TPA: paraquat-inducible protein A [Phycisphaerales bacterium]|nr:paraquat-inducible protein A [Phycisphaerales bacterium]